MSTSTWKTRAAALTLAAVSLTGCYTVDCERGKALGKDVEEQVVIANYGWAVLGIPIVCGNKDLDSWCPVTFFYDEVQPKFAYEKLLARAKAKNCKLGDVVVQYDEDIMCSWLLDIPIPWILPYYETRISANLVKKGGVK